MIELLPEIPEQARSWRNQREVYTWCRQRVPISKAHHEAWLQRIEEDPTIQMFGVYSSPVPVGVCGLTSIDHVNQHAEFSLYIAPEYQGHGYGKQALVALCYKGFYDLNLNCIWGETFSDNPAAKMFEKVGFVQEGKHRERYFKWGQRVDCYVYGLLRDEFNWQYDSDARCYVRYTD